MSVLQPKLHFERFEFKYLMHEETATRVRDTLLKNNLEWDPYTLSSSDRAYTVTSLYYDSVSVRCYRDKIDGLERRFKLRERIYAAVHTPGDPRFFEIKRKKDAVIVKDRTVNAPGTDFEYLRRRYALEPNVLVTYRRSALQGTFQERLRVTFDSELACTPARSLSGESSPYPIARGLVIMEVKYNNTLPHWFHRIILTHELDRRPFSKYCIALEACTSLLVRGALLPSLDTTTSLLLRSRPHVFM